MTEIEQLRADVTELQTLYDTLRAWCVTSIPMFYADLRRVHATTKVLAEAAGLRADGPYVPGALGEMPTLTPLEGGE